jgi:hypothetical protein
MTASECEPRRASSIVGGVIAVGFTLAGIASADGARDDRRDKAREAMELAERGRAHALQKAQEHFATQQFDKGFQELGQAMQDAKARQENQTARHDTTGAGARFRGRDNGVGATEGVTARHPTIDAPAAALMSTLDPRLRSAPVSEVAAPPAPSTPDVTAANTAMTTPAGATADTAAAAGSAFLAGLREIRASGDPEGPRRTTDAPAGSDGGERVAIETGGENASSGEASALVLPSVPAEEIAVPSRRTVSGTLGPAEKANAEEADDPEEGPSKQHQRVRRRVPSSEPAKHGATRPRGAASLEGQIVDRSELRVKAAQASR